MHGLKKLILGAGAFFCFVVVASSGSILKARIEGGWFGMYAHDYIYLGLTTLAIVYLHWVLWKFMVPMDNVPVAVKHSILRGAASLYKRDFLYGSIVLGYLLLAMYVMIYHSPEAWLPGAIEKASAGVFHYTHYAMFFIGLGIITRSRAVIKFLVEESDRKGQSSSNN